MIRAFLLASLFLATACGVQGDLYHPDTPPPIRDREETPDPFPTIPREEQIPLPDMKY